MLAQGVPGVGDQEHCSLWRNASFHSRHGHPCRRKDRRACREPPSASFWKEQIWNWSDLESCPRYHHGEIDYRICFSPGAVVRPTEHSRFRFELLDSSYRGRDVL